MRPFAQWPVWSIVVISVSWILLCVFVPMWWLSVQLQRQMAASREMGGVADAVVNVSALLVMLPSVVFWLAWFIARRSRVKH